MAFGGEVMFTEAAQQESKDGTRDSENSPPLMLQLQPETLEEKPANVAHCESSVAGFAPLFLESAKSDTVLLPPDSQPSPHRNETPNAEEKPLLLRHPVSILLENSDLTALEWGAEEAYDTKTYPKKAIIVQVTHHSAAIKRMYELTGRPEIEMDTKSLSLLLTKAGFAVEVIKDPTCADMLDLLRQEAEKQAPTSATRVSCFMLIVLTQSTVPVDGLHEALFMYDGLLTMDTICRTLARQDLRDHPLILLFHAPAGGQLNLTSSLLRRKTPAPSASKSENFFTEVHTLVIHSNSGELFSFRKPSNGSLFIRQILAGLNFNAENPSMDFVTILTRMNGQLSTYASQTGAHESPEEAGAVTAALAGYKKRPSASIRSTLTKQLYFYQ